MADNEKIITEYSASGDMTFIMKEVMDGEGNPLSTECVGWYYGTPNDEDTARYMGKLKAEY